jgi:hypothetical protein
MKTYVRLWLYLAGFFLEWEMFQTNVEKIKTQRLSSIPFFQNVEKYGTARQATDDNIIRRMRIACWITKATDTLGMCNTYCFCAATIVSPARLNITLYVHCLSCLYYLKMAKPTETCCNEYEILTINFSCEWRFILIQFNNINIQYLII